MLNSISHKKHTNGLYITRYDISDLEKVQELKNTMWISNAKALGLNVRYRIVFRGPREIITHRSGKKIRAGSTKKENAVAFDVYPILV